jgi:serine/threonine protein kinase
VTWVSDDAVARLRDLAAVGAAEEPSDFDDEAPIDVVELAPGTLVDRRFEVVSSLASGGMGTVYRAHDTRTGADVALKVAFSLRADSAARFAREASALAEVRHPHVVRYIDHGALADGDVYLAMELLEGEALSQRLSRGALEISEVLALGVAMAAGLGALHARGVLHRDVKPSNVLLVGGKVERATIVDLGLARRQADRRELTDVGSFLGTPGYVAPEQVRGERVDARADVFSLGCVLYEAVVGEPAFRGSTATDALAQILLQAAPPVREHRPDTPVEVEALLARMLHKDPAVRPADASVVLREIEALQRLIAPTRTSSATLVAAPREPRTIVDSPKGRNARTRVERGLAVNSDDEPTLRAAPVVDLPFWSEGAAVSDAPTPRAAERPSPLRRRAAVVLGGLAATALVVAWVVSSDDDRAPLSAASTSLAAHPPRLALPPPPPVETTAAPEAAEVDDMEIVPSSPAGAAPASRPRTPRSKDAPATRPRDKGAPRDKGSVPLPNDPG